MDEGGPGVYTEAERLTDAVAKRKQLEQELHDAELLLGLLRKHLETADALLRQLTPPIERPRRTIAKVTPEMEQAILRHWQAGEHRFLVIAQRVQLADVTVRRILIQHGLYQPKPPIGEALRQQIIDRFQEGRGESIRAIAKDIGYSTQAVSNLLRKAGLETDPQARQKSGGYAQRRDRTIRQS